MVNGEILAPKAFNPIKLDLKDQQIIHELRIDSRTPASVIGKRWRMKKENVLYRIDRLFKKGIIADTFTAINTKKLGYTPYNVYIRTKNLSSEKEEEFIQYLIKHPYVSWVITATGRWDILIQIFSKTAESLNNTLTEIDQKYGNFIEKKDFFIVTEFHHFTHTPLKQKTVSRNSSLPKKETGKTTPSDKLNIDIKDIEIIELLVDNAKLSLIEIAEKTKLSSDTVSYRIKKLIKQKIITHFGILQNMYLLGHQFYSLLLRIDESNKDKIKDFLDFAKNDEQINVLTKQIGEYNYVLDIDCKSNIEFNNLLKKIKELFGNIIKSYEPTIQFDQRYFSYFPKGIAQDLKDII